MSEHTYKTTDSGKEYPARFGGLEFKYQRPDAVAGDVEATLANLRAVCADDADFAEVLVGKFNGQGFDLDWQKELKSFLGQEKDGKSVHADSSVEEVYAAAQKHMDSFRIGVTRPRGTGKSGKLAKETARAEKAENTVAALYRTLNASQRKQVRAGTTDPEVLALFDGIDAEA